MASEILGLFTTPEQYQQAQRQAQEAQAIQYAQLDPAAQAQYGFYRAGQQLGGAIGGALGGEDPQLKLISQRQQLASQLDPSDPQSYMKVAQLASQSDPQFAMAVANAGRQAAVQVAQANKERQLAVPADIQKAQMIPQIEDAIEQYKKLPQSPERDRTIRILESQLNVLNPKKVEAIPNEIQIAKRVAELETQLSPDTGVVLPPEVRVGLQAELSNLKKQGKGDDVAVVGNALVSKATGNVIYKGDTPDKYTDFARKLIEAGLTPNTEPFQRRMLEHINAETQGAGKGTGNVIIGGISVDTGAAGKAAGKIIGEGVANIESQYSLKTGIGDALELIDKGIYAGAYGPEKGFVAKFSGGAIGDPKKVENTEVFMANIGEIVIPRLQQFGGNDSNEELKYLQKVVAGDQRLEPESMRRILLSAEKKIANNIARLRKQAESAGKGGSLPLEPMQPAPLAPKVTKRLNVKTGKLEPVVGE